MRSFPNLWLLFAGLWTVGVLGAFFLMRFVISPFSEWNHGDQAQLLQGMIGLAGFGAGLVVLVSAVVQLERMTARPKLEVRITKTTPQRNSIENGDILFELEVENVGGGVCRDWQVVLTGTGDWMSGTQTGWMQLSDGSQVYNASAVPLFPRSPFPLPLIFMMVRASDGAAFKWSGEVRYMIATEHEQARKRIPIRVDVEVPAHRGWDVF